MKKTLTMAALLAASINLAGCVSDDYVVGGAALGGATGAAVGGLATGNPGGALAGAAIGGAGGAIAGAVISPNKPLSPYHEPTADEYDHLTTGPARCLREGYNVDGTLVCLRWSDPYYRYTQHQSHLF